MSTVNSLCRVLHRRPVSVTTQMILLVKRNWSQQVQFVAVGEIILNFEMQPVAIAQITFEQILGSWGFMQEVNKRVCLRGGRRGSPYFVSVSVVSEEVSIDALILICFCVLVGFLTDGQTSFPRSFSFGFDGCVCF